MSARITVGLLAKVLHESQHVLLARVLRTLGQERCVMILAEALSIEHEGGMLTKDGSTRRTLGGVFLQLCRERSTATERHTIFR